MDLSTYAVSLLQDNDITALAMQMVSGAQARQAGTDNNDIMLLFHVYMGLEKFLSV